MIYVVLPVASLSDRELQRDDDCCLVSGKVSLTQSVFLNSRVMEDSLISLSSLFHSFRIFGKGPFNYYVTLFFQEIGPPPTTS